MKVAGDRSSHRKAGHGVQELRPMVEDLPNEEG
jgi:hypothetical protein